MHSVDILATCFLIGAGLCLLAVYLYRHMMRPRGRSAGTAADGCEGCTGPCAPARKPDDGIGRNGRHTAPYNGGTWIR